MKSIQTFEEHVVEDMLMMMLLATIFSPGFATSTPSVSPDGNVNVQYNTNFTLTCSYEHLITNGDQFQISWRLAGRPQITTDQNCTILAGSYKSYLSGSCPDLREQTLTFVQVNLSLHNTTWKCELKIIKDHTTRIDSDDSTTIHVIVPVDRIELTEPKTNTIDVTEGTQKTFVCETSASRPSAIVTWYKGGDNCMKTGLSGYINTSYIRAENDLNITKSVLIYNATRVDQGCTIYCNATNVASTNVESTRRPQLNVLYSPDGQPVIHELSGNSYTLVENMTLNLTCEIEGGNPLANLTWYCNAGKVTDESYGSKTVLRITWRAEREPCKCVASHFMFSTNRSTSIIVEILYPPSTPMLSIDNTERMGTVKVINNTEVPVTCFSSSKPRPSYKWLYKDTEYNGNTITLLPTENSTLTCMATNTMTVSTGDRNTTIPGNSTSGISFHVLYGPTKPVIHCEQHLITGQTVDVIHGYDLSLTCSANGDPPPKYTWNEGAGKNITVAIKMDNLVYNCTATNELKPDYGNQISKSASSIVHVNRLYKPHTMPVIKYNNTSEQTYNLTQWFKVAENSSFSMICDSSDGQPPPSYKWTGAASSVNGFLDIREIKRSPSIDADGTSYYQYTCIVQNEMVSTCGDRSQNGTLIRDVTVGVLYPAVLDPHYNQTAEEGKYVFLSTTVTTHGSPRETYKWLYSKSGIGSRTELANTLTHTIQNISRSEAGFYTIAATNLFDPTGLPAEHKTVSQTFYLNVFYTTSISNFTIGGQPDNTTYNENDTDIEVRCHVDSNPSSDMELYAATYSDDERIAGKNSTSALVYTIHTATCFDMGVYRCTGKNNYTRTPVSMEARLFVRCTPRPRYKVLQNITFYKALNDSVTLNLSVIAYPEPSLEHFNWEKVNGTTTTNMTNKANVNISVVSLEPSLTIQSLQQNDFGQYRLRITYNISRSYYHYFFINPQDKPQVPNTFSHIQAILSATTAGFEWTPGFDGGLEQTFCVSYKIASDLLWKYLNVSTNTVILTGLAPGTVYNVKMFASNSLGNSLETVTLNITTKELVNSSPPLALIGGAAGGGVGLLLAVVLGVIFYRKTSRPKDSQNDQCRDSLCNDDAIYDENDSQNDQGRDSLCNDDAIYDENGMEINPAYESADSLGIQQPSTSRDVHAQVDKSRKTQNANVNDNVYAVVEKRKKKDNDATVQMDVYATPVKGKIGKRGKKGKGGKKKGKCVHEDAEEMNVYSNVGYENEAQQGNVYVNVEETRARKKNVNKDGLLYADIAFEKNNKGQRKLIIHGQENATEYIQIDFTKRADPLPDSHEEEDNF